MYIFAWHPNSSISSSRAHCATTAFISAVWKKGQPTAGPSSLPKERRPRIVTSTSIGAAQNGRMCNKARMMQARNFRRDPDPAQTVGRVRSLQVACSASGMTPGRGSKKVRGLGSWFPCRPTQAETARPPFPALDTSSLCSPHADMMPPTRATSERCLSAVEVGRRSALRSGRQTIPTRRLGGRARGAWNRTAGGRTGCATCSVGTPRRKPDKGTRFHQAKTHH